jgi:hypothetical protein
MTIDPLRAIRELASEGGARWFWGQVRVDASETGGWRLRHAGDHLPAWEELKPLSVEELQEWGDLDQNGDFRPLRSAPTLRNGWWCDVPDLGLLEDALNRLYPGSVADWWAFKEHGTTAATSFREFVNRQTGMYRSAQQLSAAGAEAAVRACCSPDMCQKRRMWTVDSLGPSDYGSFPCLEPCAVALEMARQAAKLERGPQVTLTLPEPELRTLVFALCDVIAGRISDGKGHEEGKLDEPHNTRRIRLLLERIQPELQRVSDASAK